MAWPAFARQAPEATLYLRAENWLPCAGCALLCCAGSALSRRVAVLEQSGREQRAQLKEAEMQAEKAAAQVNAYPLYSCCGACAP